MIKCLYIAGTLFMTNGEYAIPIGPHDLLQDKGEVVGYSGFSERTNVQKYTPDQTLAEFLIQCDHEATKRIAEEEQW